MPSKNSVTRTIRFCKEDVKAIEECMDAYGISFNKAVHTLISKNSTDYQLDLSEFIDMEGERVDDLGKRRYEFDCMRQKLPELVGTRCAKCGSDEYIEYHHIKPLSRGGTNKLSNIIPLCSQCHSKVHGRDCDSEKERLIKEKEKLKIENRQLQKRITALKQALVAISEE